MVAHGRVELLAHPLSQKYLQMKWNSYGKYFHVANLLFYCIFLAFVTIFAAQLMGYCTEKTANNTYCNSSGSQSEGNKKVMV
jgi:transient receptor potential cation channel subfamily A protein 1